MVIVDTHCHASPFWYEPVESLLFQMDRNDVDHALLVQHLGEYDHEYFFDCIDRHPGRLSAVVLVDPAREDAAQELDRLAERGARGLRLKASARSTGDDPLLLWKKAQELGLPISCSSGKRDYLSPEFAGVLEACRRVPVILEHLASLNHPDGESPPFEIRKKIFELARFPNVYLKFHGLGEICSRTSPVTHPSPFHDEGLTILDLALESFGPQRMMWGSDFPPVSGREGYRNALQLPMARLRAILGNGEGRADGAKAALAAMFGCTAGKVYGLD